MAEVSALSNKIFPFSPFIIGHNARKSFEIALLLYRARGAHTHIHIQTHSRAAQIE